MVDVKIVGDGLLEMKIKKEMMTEFEMGSAGDVRWLDV